MSALGLAPISLARMRRHFSYCSTAALRCPLRANKRHHLLVDFLVPWLQREQTGGVVDASGILPAYEQIYALAGPIQNYPITGDPRILRDAELTVDLFDRFYLDRNYGGYFSHLDPVTLDPRSESLGANKGKKNWNSVGDHAPAYLINLYLATGEDRVPLTLSDYLAKRCAVQQTVYDVTPPAVGGSGRPHFPGAVEPAPGWMPMALRQGLDTEMLGGGLRDLVQGLALDFLLIDSNSGINELSLTSLAISDVAAVVLRLDKQDYQGTAVTVDLARKLERIPVGADRQHDARHVRSHHGPGEGRRDIRLSGGCRPAVLGPDGGARGPGPLRPGTPGPSIHGRAARSSRDVVDPAPCRDEPEPNRSPQRHGATKDTKITDFSVLLRVAVSRWRAIVGPPPNPRANWR